jgi:hypothetical protein
LHADGGQPPPHILLDLQWKSRHGLVSLR